ncbi:tubby-like F-box protein 11 [Triticum urartu]|uniref:Tubby-like F-box protein n=2 Tax=Triticum urartu TaxID=4572 RepID=A0A8R7PAP0_TRIUA|nr:tubby-like F-box protein 11 [Triticum urartu]
MPFRSMVREMRGEVDAIARRRPLPSSARGVRRVAAVAPPGEEAARQGCCWAELPPELLREVLARVEASEPRWPRRRDVVACAGVCRTWRGVVREIVRVPEVSGRLTFPISLKQPGPRDAPIKCFIRRHRATQTYFLYIELTDALADAGKFLLAARKYHRPTCTEYLISLDKTDMSKGSQTCVGKLRSNFLRTKFTVYDAHPPHAGPVVPKRWPAGDYPVIQINYEVNVLGSRGPRRMNCIMDSIPVSAIEHGGTAPTQTAFPFFNPKSSRMDSSITPLSSQVESKLVLKNKSPRWHEHLRCWCLNFHGRVTVASVKNFQLVASDESAPANEENDDTTLQFGKIGKDLFTLDYRYPVSAFQAFAICLSSFDTKLARE